ncbi:hypothetical protein H4R19_001721 [Coemansia spiralis]|nr:hypothetical protein H4R19_001721 [Coemansia spiralis]
MSSRPARELLPNEVFERFRDEAHWMHGEPSSYNRWEREDRTRAACQTASDLFRFRHPEVIGVARPKDLALRQLAEVISEQVSANLDYLVDKSDAPRIPADLVRAGDKAVADALRSGGFVAMCQKPAKVADFVDAVCGEFGELWPIVVDDALAPASNDIYRWVQHLLLFVAHHMRRYLHGVSGHGLVPRMVLPYPIKTRAPKTDGNDEESDDSDASADSSGAKKSNGLPTPGLQLVVRSTDIEPGVIENTMPYLETFALVEARDMEDSDCEVGGVGDPPHNVSEVSDCTEKAFVRLFECLPPVYEYQYFRRFAWGLTQCGSMACVSVFVNGGAVASNGMDLRTKAGRCKYISILVNWSVCELHMLGYDPTIKWLRPLNCWQVDVPDALSRTGRASSAKAEITTFKTVPYYFKTAIEVPYDLFGKHSRRFLATPVKPTVRVDDEHPIVPTVIVKDSWSYVEYGLGERHGPTHPTEIECLLEIGDKMQGDEHRDSLQTIVHGGPMRMEVGGMFVLDTTDHILGPYTREKPSGSGALRRLHAHYRLATTPVAHMVSGNAGVCEYIMIMSDVVFALKAVSDKCQILYNGITPNSIMFTRDDSGMPHGILAEFDKARRMTTDAVEDEPVD